jgi:glycosyltransferase involved in cell wall biosynthesis
VLDLSEYSFKTKDFSKLNIIIWWRFIEKKWILELIDLIYLLSKENFVWKIWLVWDGELKEQIFTKISTLGLNDTIKYYWFLEHKEFLEALWSYNCFINYSKIWSDWDNEGTNNVISENILVGNLVFSTIVWWIWDIIDDWETWFSLIWQADKDLAKIKNSFLINNLWKIVKTWLKKVKNLFAFKNSIIKLENTIKNNL